MKHRNIQITVSIDDRLVFGGKKAAVEKLDGRETVTICTLSATTGGNAVAADTLGA